MISSNTINVMAIFISTSLILFGIYDSDSKEQTQIKERQDNVMRFLEEHKLSHLGHDAELDRELSSYKMEIEARFNEALIRAREREDERERRHNVEWPRQVVRDRIFATEECAAKVCPDYKRPSNLWN